MPLDVDVLECLSEKKRKERDVDRNRFSEPHPTLLFGYYCALALHIGREKTQKSFFPKIYLSTNTNKEEQLCSSMSEFRDDNDSSDWVR